MTVWPHVMPALVTAIGDGHDLDLPNHAHNVTTAVVRGADGVLIGGSTGEGPYLEPGERTALVAGAKEAAPDATVMCGIFAESERQAFAQLHEAHDGGADAVLVATPTTLVRGRDRLVADYFEWVADTAPVPVFLYTVPKVTGYELPCHVVAELAGHPNVAGMKDSTGDPGRLDDLANVLSSEFIVYAGASRALSASAQRGAYGAITASANYAFDLVRGAVSRDAAAQQMLVDVSSVVEQHGVAGTKFAASTLGMDCGDGRPPLPQLDDEAKAAIRRAVRPLDVSPSDRGRRARD